MEDHRKTLLQSDRDERIRAVILSSSNPLRSYADTTAYEEVFKKLDLLATVELAMTETAELSDYVLPARSAYEAHDGSFFTWNYPEMKEWMVEIEPEKEERMLQPDAEFPLILNAGRHKPKNAYTLMRNPVWNKGRRTCTLAMNPEDAAELEVTEETRKGQVLIPHGFGLKYKGKVHGININRLTKNSHRDRLAATPLHCFVRCRVEKCQQ